MERPEGETEAPIRVVVVDDDAQVVDLLRCALETFGVTVVGAAQNGAQACELYRELRPDVVVMDVRMPFMDGLEALRTIRQEDPEALVVMITAYHEKDEESQAIALGCQGFIHKPFQIQQLYDDLTRSLVRLRLRASHRGLRYDEEYVHEVLEPRFGEPGQSAPVAPRQEGSRTQAGETAGQGRELTVTDTSELARLRDENEVLRRDVERLRKALSKVQLVADGALKAP